MLSRFPGVLGSLRFYVGTAGALLFLSACGCENAPASNDAGADVDGAEPPDEIPPGDPGRVIAVPRTGAYRIPTLRQPVHVLRTEMNVPHIYAANERDLRVVQGFIAAKERFFQLDIIRRYGLGEISDLLGGPGLALDQLNRARGTLELVVRLESIITATQTDLLTAYSEGINAYLDEVAAGRLPPSSEHRLALPLVRPGGRVVDIMRRFTVRDMLGFAVGVLFNTSFEEDDLIQGLAEESLGEVFDGDPFELLRSNGAREDILNHVEPSFHIRSTPGLGTSIGGTLMASLLSPVRPWDMSGTSRSRRGRRSNLARIPEQMRERLLAQMELTAKMHGDLGTDFGSNAFALSSRGTQNGAAILASDSHLALTVAPIYLQMGLDTTVFGESAQSDGFTQFGLFFPGVMHMVEGTNGRVAWGNTFQEGDSTEFYREEIQLDNEGLPEATRYQGAWRPIIRTPESYHVAAVTLFESVERTETHDRYSTFDGRHIVQMEGQVLAEDEAPPEGSVAIDVGGTRVVPGDTNQDGRIVAISIDTVMYDSTNLLTTLERLGLSTDVTSFREALRTNVGFVENFTIADNQGNVGYSGYSALPCRGYLRPAGQTTGWAAGANPQRIIDGTRYPGFHIPTQDGMAEEGRPEEEQCVIRFDEFPQMENPTEGFALNANNDLAGLSFDGDLSNDPIYLGGPYDISYRAHLIYDTLAASVAARSGNVETMGDLQSSHRSILASEFWPFLQQAVARVRSLAAMTERTPDEDRLVALYQTSAEAIDQAATRLDEWVGRGSNAASGVSTQYHVDVAAEQDDAIGAMIFHEFFLSFVRRVFEDEGITQLWSWDPDAVLVNNLQRLLAGRGAGNPRSLASFNSGTNESVFFDQRNTAPVEQSDEALVGALLDAVQALSQPQTSPGIGGFGTTDQTQWLWGLRHLVVLDSLVKTYAGSSLGALDSVLASLAFTPRNFPLGVELVPSDPRADLPAFPRPGGLLTIDTGGFDLVQRLPTGPTISRRYWMRSGSVMRQVIEVGPSGVRGRTILPGGISGLSTSPNFSDQARLWLGNQTLPLRFDLSSVVEGAVGRERFLP